LWLTGLLHLTHLDMCTSGKDNMISTKYLLRPSWHPRIFQTSKLCFNGHLKSPPRQSIGPPGGGATPLKLLVVLDCSKGITSQSSAAAMTYSQPPNHGVTTLIFYFFDRRSDINSTTSHTDAKERLLREITSTTRTILWL
jgi:hypothetical protein